MRSRTTQAGREHDFRTHMFMSRLGSDVALLEARGFSLEQREDHVFSELRKLERASLNEQVMGMDLLQGVKRKIADMIADALNMTPGFFRDTIVNFVVSLGISDLKSFMQPGACTKVIEKLAIALQGAVVDHFLKTTGLAPTNFLAIAVVEALKSGFIANGPFVRAAAPKICSLKLSDLLPGGSGSTTSAAGTAEAVPTP